MRQLPILMYHWFRPAGAPSASRSPQLEIEPERFEAQMARLAAAGRRSVALGDFLDGRSGRRDVGITFDDGTRDFWDHARPALLRQGLRASLFVVTGAVGGTSDWDRDLGEPARPLLDWEQIRALHDEGFEIGSHTETHRVLTRLSDDEALGELKRSREALADRLGQPPRLLAWPRGFYAERHKDLARRAGYSGACAVVLGWGDLREADRFSLKRMTIKGGEADWRFAARLWLGSRIRFRQTAALR